MSLFVLVVLVVASGLAFATAVARRLELRRMHGQVKARDEAIEHGAAKAQLQHPVVDLSRCLGCGTCVMSCPEDGVLELVHGQAMVVRGARCQGISACARECPVGAITVTLADVKERDDIPALSESLEAVGTQGLFLAGEVTAHALIKTAIDHGVAVAGEVGRRRLERVPSLVAGGAQVRAQQPVSAVAVAEPEVDASVEVGSVFDTWWSEDGEERSAESGGEQAAAARVEVPVATPGEPLDLVIVGAGPAGLACALEARRLGLSFVLLDREAEVGGTVAKYPRRKLVVTQPIEMPLVGKLRQTSFTKEELMDLWRGIIAREELTVETGVVFDRSVREVDGTHTVHTNKGTWRAHNVCLAIGRRGVPRELGVPGEELSKVAYALLDARSYQGRHVLVVGGGDSAVEAALGLAEQPGNTVTLSYRKGSFFRIKGKNQERLDRALAEGRLSVLFHSEVRRIGATEVELVVREAGQVERDLRLQNDEVFLMLGGLAPTALLQESGVSFDPSLRQEAEVPTEEGTGLVRALGFGFGMSLAVLVWVLWHADYYLLDTSQRPSHAKHAWLRSSRGAGLWAGITAAGLIVVNLLYLWRRHPGSRMKLGSLQAWMSSHVATGILAFLLVVIHAALAPKNTVGGHAFTSLGILLVTGAIGRYFYAYVPRAANGRELELAEVKARLGRLSDEWGPRAAALPRPRAR